MGQVTAREATALGINWLFAPVVDVQSNPNNPVIDVRAFGSSPERVGELASAFIRGAKTASVLTTAKHFPGHGDTSVDSHLILPELSHPRARLESLEWQPFQQAISAGVDAIMSAHLMVPKLDPDWPATLSEKMLEGVLRQEWNFDGLVVTDAMTMGAMAQFPSSEAPLSGGELAVRALEAGADVIVMPPQPLDAIEAICAAVESGRLSRQRIRQSVERILNAKHRVCDSSRMEQLPIERLLPGARPTAKPANAPPALTELLGTAPRNKPSSLERLLETAVSSATPADAIARVVGTSASRLISEAIAIAAVHPYRRQELPLQAEPNWLNWMWTDRWLSAGFVSSTSPAIESATAQGVPTLLADLNTPAFLLELALDGASGLVVQVFVQSGPFRGHGGLSPATQHLLMRHWQKVKALVCYGSRSAFDRMLELSEPYGFPCIYSGDRRDVAQAEVAKQLWGSELQAVKGIPEA